MKVYCTLTKEQASLYEAVVREAESAIEESEGIGRKGLILATLTKLKQVCNHPRQLLGDGSPIEGRSGKLARLSEMTPLARNGSGRRPRAKGPHRRQPPARSARRRANPIRPSGRRPASAGRT